MDKSSKRVLMMTILLLCMMMPDPQSALPTCFKYPRYFVSTEDSNYILSMDMHFPTDLMIYVGYSSDYNFNRNVLCPGCAIPVVAAMSIADPIFKWTLAAV